MTREEVVSKALQTARRFAHTRFWEALGFAMVLVASFLEWSSVQRDNTDMESLVNVIDGFQSFKMMMRLSQENMSGFAELRATSNTPADLTNLFPDAAKAWESARVRLMWTRGATNTLDALHLFGASLLHVAQKRNIHPQHDPLEIRNRIKLLARTINSRLDTKLSIPPAADWPHNLGDGPRTAAVDEFRVLVVDPNKLSSIGAASIDRQILRIDDDLRLASNELRAVIDAETETHSRIHGLLFLLGSTIVVLAYLVDWWSQSQPIIS